MEQKAILARLIYKYIIGNKKGKETNMKRIILTAVLFILTGITAAAASVSPVDIQFQKHGGGQFLYCNNPEFVTESDLSTDENPNPVYMMKQEGLKPGKYSVFFCFYNWTEFDVEPDIEFVSENAEITINSVGYYIPKGWDFWDCLGAWSDYTGMNIRTIDGLTQYVPCSGINLPQSFKLKDSAEWINKYIYNYEAVSPKVTFNMLVDFTIESGTADVNFAALKSYDVLGDRSHNAKNALQSPYKNDTSIKGIERETLPMTECELNVEITSKTKNGNIPVKVKNQYFPFGNVYDYWMTNINPSRDAYSYSKECCAGADMFEFEFKDMSKLNYYGSAVSNSNRDNVWRFDIYHHNTTEYTEGCPSKSKNTHIPNDKLPEKLNINNPPDLDYEFNLGNFGVTNRYYLNVKNSDNIQRSINYYIDASLSSCILAVRDTDGVLLNPYTLSKDGAYAISKGINWEKKRDYMFSLMLNPGESRNLILDVTLPTNCYGGIVNGLTADTSLLAEPVEITDFAVKNEEYTDRMWFDGNKLMKWEDGELYIYGEEWKRVKLPSETREVFKSRTKDIRITKTTSGYIARFAGYDQYGRNIADTDKENKLYILGEAFEYIKTINMPSYISESVYADGITYIKSDKIYESSNGITFLPSDIENMPVSDGKSVIEKRSDGWYIKYNGEKEFIKINFEYPEVSDIKASDGVYYMIRSLKNYDTDKNTPNIIAVSTDGVNFRNMTLPNRQFRFMRLDAVGDKLYAVGRNEVYERAKSEFTGGEIIKTNKGYLSLNYIPEKIDSTTCLSLEFLERVFGFKTTAENNRFMMIFEDKTVSFIPGVNALYSGDKSIFTKAAPIEDGANVYVPFLALMSLM